MLAKPLGGAKKPMVEEPMTIRHWTMGLFVLWVNGCDTASDQFSGPNSETVEGERLEGVVVEVACASCIFEMADTQGCQWAAHIGDEYYLLNGPVPAQHEMHAPDGICRMPRQARVIGQIRGQTFVAEQFSLLPATDVPEDAELHDHDH